MKLKYFCYPQVGLQNTDSLHVSQTDRNQSEEDVSASQQVYQRKSVCVCVSPALRRECVDVCIAAMVWRGWRRTYWGWGC